MAHYFDSNPETASDKKVISYRRNGVNFEFVTDTNVFCRDKIDFGTDLLLEAMIEDLKTSGSKVTSVLDLGCGYGCVGIVMKSVFKAASITCTDVNERAVSLCKENSKLNGTPIKKIVSGDCLAELNEEDMFDVVATNPPVRAGKKTVFEFYTQAFEHMVEGGRIYVVLQRKQGAPSSEKKLLELFGNCETIEIEAGYHIMRSIKTSTEG